VIFSEEVLDDICSCICEKPPEEGGFLFSREDDMTVVKFVWDTAGGTTRTSYYPSRNASRIINDTENGSRNSKQLLTFSGVVHSHPRTMSYPSGPDCEAMESLLSLNTNLPFVIAPIVTHGNYSHTELYPHELQLRNLGKISCYYKIAGHQVLRFRRAATIHSVSPLGRNLGVVPNGYVNHSQSHVANSLIPVQSPTSSNWKPAPPYDDIVVAIYEIKKCIGLSEAMCFSPIRMVKEQTYCVLVQNWKTNPGPEFVLLFGRNFPSSYLEYVLPSSPDQRIPVSWRENLAYPERATKFLSELTNAGPLHKQNLLQASYHNVGVPNAANHILGSKKSGSPKILIIGDLNSLVNIASGMVQEGYLRIYLIESTSNSVEGSLENIKQHLLEKNPKANIAYKSKSVLENKTELRAILHKVTLVILVSSSSSQVWLDSISSLEPKKPVINEEGAPVITNDNQQNPTSGLYLQMILTRVREVLHLLSGSFR